ncbi:TrmH family RNA methyltransferase [Nocardioides sp. GXQ0305]|uniref:TrmH family RNA methyltransferase n=1 Tax=Nocardioides sp. GXQ0305 TaxID=3423912 RepID=UPI003D7D84AC
MQPLAAGSARVKEARRLSRRPARAERRLFLADGPKAVEGALGTLIEDAGPPLVVEVFATPAATTSFPALVRLADSYGIPWTLVDDRAIAGLSDSVTSAGVVAVCRFLDRPVDDVVGGGDLVVLAADVRDPGNAGTLVRTADAVGATGVVLAGHSVDAYNPKTVRATVGSLFHLPVALAPDPAAAVRSARAAGLTVLAADGAGEVDLFAADELVRGPVAWLFGNEAWGLPAELAALADHRVAIPIPGRAESLNLATAAAVCLYATSRARLG